MEIIKAKNAEELTKILKEAAEGGAHIIGATEPQKCDLCGALEETRPYGPKGENVCFDCGMKDEATAKRGFNKAIDSARTGKIGSA